MRFFLTLIFLCLSLPAFAQDSYLWIENVQFYQIIAGRNISKIEVDKLTANIYTEDDVIRVKVMPSKLKLIDDETDIMLANINLKSDKGRSYKYTILLTSDLTDGTSKHPCSYGTAGGFGYLDTESPSQQFHITEGNPLVVEVTPKRLFHATQGYEMNIPVLASWKYAEKPKIRTLKTSRSSSRATESRR